MYQQKQQLFVSQSDPKILWIILLLLTVTSSSDAVSLSGSSEYAVPGTEFTLTCDVPEEAKFVLFYRRPNVTTPVGSIQVDGDQCYNIQVTRPVPCTPDVCSCVTSGVHFGTVFRWIIQPQTGDHGSVWYCRRTNYNLPNRRLNSADYTLNVADQGMTIRYLMNRNHSRALNTHEVLLQVLLTCLSQQNIEFKQGGK
ncbi:uncharacterized protein LOC117340637 [Pecten maximus]|uniref:uncharacterized protein LOC117340637 n=1 Tax=Pecten maximus TaxID=6579 RepID=UPI0014587D2D|nr:uncharacterized protein LOC117340637 [Pecten maximus]